MENVKDNRPFRPCVGIFLINSEGKIFVGARNDLSGNHWQMPQGGIDDGETPEIAAIREMEEEIGTAKAEIILAHERWIYYRLPSELSKIAWNGRFQGQKQKWFALRFLGSDADIDIETDHPEFQFLPRKFKIALSGSPRDRAVTRAHDIGLRMVKKQGLVAFG